MSDDLRDSLFKRMLAFVIGLFLREGGGGARKRFFLPSGRPGTPEIEWLRALLAEDECR